MFRKTKNIFQAIEIWESMSDGFLKRHLRRGLEKKSKKLLLASGVVIEVNTSDELVFESDSAKVFEYTENGERREITTIYDINKEVVHMQFLYSIRNE